MNNDRCILGVRWPAFATTVASIALLGVIACTRPTEPSAADPPSGCPLGIAGARATEVDSMQGADVTITGAADVVDEIRTRTRTAAQLYGPGAHKGLGHNGKHFGAQAHGLRLTELPPLDATVEDVADGARIHLVAKVSTQIDELRDRVRERVAQVAQGPCD